MAPTAVFLPGESHGQRSLAGYRPWGRKDSDTTKRLTPPPSGSLERGEQHDAWGSVFEAVTLWLMQSVGSRDTQLLCGRRLLLLLVRGWSPCCRRAARLPDRRKPG